MINSCIYNKIIHKCSSVSVETGGIIGGNNDVVQKFCFDKGVEGITLGCYIPDVDLLVTNLFKWQKRGIEFMGIAHSHTNEYQNLSSNDRNYIREIMMAMPQEKNMLYFPIVYSKSIHSYKAVRDRDELYISNDDVILI